MKLRLRQRSWAIGEEQAQELEALRGQVAFRVPPTQLTGFRVDSEVTEPHLHAHSPSASDDSGPVENDRDRRGHRFCGNCIDEESLAVLAGA